MTTREPLTHDEAIELLPWLVNESLAADEQQAVGAHARSCVICRRELAELKALKQSIDSAAEQVVPPPPDMRRINARIDAQLEQEARGNALLSAAREFFGSPWRVAFAVQTLALVAIAVVWLQPPAAEREFVTLTAPEALPAGHYLRVVFDPMMAGADIAALVEASELSVATGPTERGVYTLAFADSLSGDERTAVADALGADGRVLFLQAVEGTSR